MNSNRLSDFFVSCCFFVANKEASSDFFFFFFLSVRAPVGGAASIARFLSRRPDLDFLWWHTKHLIWYDRLRYDDFVFFV